MKVGTLVLLGLAFAGLGVLYLKRSEEEKNTTQLHPVRHPLFVGFAANRVSAVRIDNLERGVQVKLERDQAGSWFLTDPIAYPAIDELLRTLLATLSNSLGEVDARVDPEEVGLDPPLIVVEVEQQEEGGLPRSYRLEVGAVDLDPSKIYVRVPGHPVDGEGRGIFRAPRTIYNTLDRNPDDFRDARITHLRSTEVTSFRRRGRAFVEDLGVEVDLDFDALLEPEGWKKVDPPVVSLDPVALQLLCRGSAELKALAFTDDHPTSMADYGLDPARFTIELQDLRGEATLLHFGYPEEIGPGIQGTEGWYVRREGFPHVWEVHPGDIALLIRPADMLYDYALVRALREDILRVELQGNGRTLVLERPDGQGEDWTVGEEGSELRYPADPGEVEDLLALMEGTQLGDYLPGTDFDEEDPPRSLTLVTRNGGRWGGEVGVPRRDAGSGSPGRLFRRYGDELVGWIEDSVADLCLLTAEDLRSKRIHKIDVFRDHVRWIKVRKGARELAYLRLNETDWISGENEVPAPGEFEEALDSLLNLAAEEWQDAPVGELEETVEVEVAYGTSAHVIFTLGRDADGRALCLENGLTAVIDPGIEAYPGRDLIESLSGLFGD